MASKRPLSAVEAPLPRHVIAAAVAEGEYEVTISKSLADGLKDHQVDGLRFMWKHLSKDTGCMLAHSMGLGKSAQGIIMINLMITLKGIKTILLVTPKSTIASWSTEIPLWCKKGGYNPINQYIVGDDTIATRRQKVEQWKSKGGILLMSYELYGYTVGAYNKGKSRPVPEVVAALQSPGPDMVLCDEGHTIRNHDSGIATSLNLIGTPRRLMLTGTPMQNCLEELWGMIEFVRPGYFPLREFVGYFVQPIKHGQTIQSSHSATKLMKERAYILQRELSSFVDRRDQSILIKELPPKLEYVVVCPLGKFQRGLQGRFRDWFMARAKLVRGHNILLYTHVLNKISGHPDLLKTTLEEVLENKNNSSLEFGWASELSWADDVILNNKSYKPMMLSRSPKMTALMYIVEYCIRHKEKLLIFSQWTMSIELIMKFVDVISSKVDMWSLTGGMPMQKRKIAINAFQQHPGPCLFLISTTAGGMGINLNTAHKAVLFDVSFNPAVDQQAVFRCYRYGLKHKVRIYRLITTRTPEESAYRSCLSKEWLGKKVVDGGTPSRAHVKGYNLVTTKLFEDPDRPDSDDDENRALWEGEERLAFKEDPLLLHLSRKMSSHDIPIRKVFRHQSLLLSEDDVPTPEQVAAYQKYCSMGGRRILKNLVAADLHRPSVGASSEVVDDDDFYNFINTAAPLPNDIQFGDDDDDDDDDDGGFVPDVDG
eukprot:TRINITY_DN1438_c0_g3_i1.p1 TRINITY_DN1438_c0_g3~~TRINITY_DN1438_c0_g3_i1.p1  ORF type:complete len:710 (+),score=94.80 TRINITY_DN1438_c0_g3_i1:102-2231(+)